MGANSKFSDEPLRANLNLTEFKSTRGVKYRYFLSIWIIFEIKELCIVLCIMLCRLGINLLHQAILDFRLRYALSTTDKGLQKFQSCFNLNSLTLLCRFHCVNNILHDFFRLQGVPVNIKKFSKCIKWNGICTGKVKQSTVTRGNDIRSTHHNMKFKLFIESDFKLILIKTI